MPTLLTLWILAWGYGKVQEHVAVHINRGIVKAAVWFHARDGISAEALQEYEAKLEARFVNGFAGSLVGLLIAMAVIVLVGALLASVVGRSLWRVIERFITNTPVLRRIYPHVKQVTDFILTQEQQKKMFSRVVAVEAPRKGIWSVGFVTGSGLRTVAAHMQKEFLTVLVPKSPAMVSGYLITVPKDETIALDMTIEEACRFLVSAGVICSDVEPSDASPGIGRAPEAVVGAVKKMAY